MKKRLSICLLALASLTAVSVNAYNNYSSAAPQETTKNIPVPCDTVPCYTGDSICAPVPCAPAPCTPAPAAPAPCPC